MNNKKTSQRKVEFSEEKSEYLFSLMPKAYHFEQTKNYEQAISVYETIYNFVLDNKKHFRINNFSYHLERLMILYRKCSPHLEIPFIKNCLNDFKELLDEKTEIKWKTRLNNLTLSENNHPIITHSYTPQFPTINQKIENIKTDFIEFDFYEKDPHFDRSVYPSLKYLNINKSQFHLIQKYLELKHIFDDLILKGSFEESKKDYTNAIRYYEIAISEECFLSKPYERLIVIYNKLKMEDDLVRVLTTGIKNLSTLKEQQKDFMFKLAKTPFRLEKTKEYIENNKKIMYYHGAFELYNPYPILEKWKQRLFKIVSQKSG